MSTFIILYQFDGDLWKFVGADADGKNASDIIGIVEALSKGGK